MRAPNFLVSHKYMVCYGIENPCTFWHSTPNTLIPIHPFSNTADPWTHSTVCTVHSVLHWHFRLFWNQRHLFKPNGLCLEKVWVELNELPIYLLHSFMFPLPRTREERNQNERDITKQADTLKKHFTIETGVLWTQCNTQRHDMYSKCKNFIRKSDYSQLKQ